MTDREAERSYREARRKEAERANRLQEEEHSVGRGARLRDGLDPDDTGEPSTEHRGGYLQDGVDATPEELEEHNLAPGGSVARRMRRGEL